MSFLKAVIDKKFDELEIAPRRKVYEYVDMKKQPFGKHLSTRNSVNTSPRFTDLIIRHKECDPVDLKLKIALNIRKRIPRNRVQTTSHQLS
jgi:hypothetical protein